MESKRPPCPSQHPETLAVHAGFRGDPSSGSVAVPIHQTTAYLFDDANHAEQVFALEGQGDFYTRVTNPTVRVLEKRIAALEGGVSACCLASGQAASAAAIQNLVRAGENIVATNNLYGGTITLLRYTLERQGIEVRFVDPERPENFLEASDDSTRCWFGESLPNPNLTPFPIAEVADLGKTLGIPLIIDNTCAPLICRPFDHGAAIIVHSITKYIGGSGNSLGGAIVDSGTFDWNAYPHRNPSLCAPDPAYHDIVWAESESSDPNFSPFIQRLRFCLLRDIGYSLSPMNAFLILQGLETLPLRLAAHTANAHKVAEFLQGHDQVSKVIHPSLFTDIDGERATKYLTKRGSGLVGFHLRGGAEAGRAFIDALKLFFHVSNIGDTRSLVTMPSITTHSQLDDITQSEGGVCDAYIRLSIGIEHIDDILCDLKQALASIQG